MQIIYYIIYFILDILWYVGCFIWEYPVLSIGGLFFLLFAAIMIHSAGGLRNVLSPPRKMNSAERMDMMYSSKANRAANTNNSNNPNESYELEKEKMHECANCGAPLESENAVCEYCGMRNKDRSDLPNNEVRYV